MARSKQGAASRKAPKERALPQGSYPKGVETRERILDAALTAFGEAPFRAVTTRQICNAASVSLPTLQYYFGDKEGLYLACAETIIERYRRHTKAAGAKAAEALSEGCSPETARAQLKALIGALAGFLVGSTEAASWAQFVSRELRDPGPAFEVLYAGLWRPGVEITSRLIARTMGISDDAPAARVRALLLISSLLAFQSRRSVSMRTMNWSVIGPDELSTVLAGIEAQIDAIGPE
jgi:AcrR family transcriptional regulator